MSKEVNRRIHYGGSGGSNNPFFYFGGTRHYLGNILRSDGLDSTCFTNCGYFGGFKLLRIEHDIDDSVVLEVVKNDFKT